MPDYFNSHNDIFIPPSHNLLDCAPHIEDENLTPAEIYEELKRIGGNIARDNMITSVVFPITISFIFHRRILSASAVFPVDAYGQIVEHEKDAQIQQIAEQMKRFCN